MTESNLSDRLRSGCEAAPWVFDEVRRLEGTIRALRSENERLRSLVVMRFDHDHPPQFTQGYDTHELTEPVTAEHCRWFVAEIERLNAEVAHIKEVEFPRKAQAVADVWRTKCERLEAKIAEMEQQKPVMWANSSNINSSRINKERGGCGDQHTCSETQTAYHDAPLYALPGVQSSPEISDEMRERVMDALAEELGNAYYCVRHWSAWNYGTMGRSDFSSVTDDQDRLAEIADAAIRAVFALTLAE